MIAKRLLLFLALCIPATAQGMNLLRPYDSLLRPDYSHDYRVQTLFVGETGIADRAYSRECSTNALRIWNNDQNALTMLDGFASDTDIGKKRIEIDASDDGTRGHFCVDGDLKNYFSGIFGARFFFRDDWSFSMYLPLYSMALKNVCWTDKTNDVSDEDLRVKELLTDNFFENVCNLGCDLDLCGWSRTGVGDLTFMMDWSRNFVQAKPMLKNVRLNWRLGLGVPTGLRQDEDKLFAFPYGYDGAFSLPFGLGLDLYFDFYVRAGFDVQLTHVFGNTRTRRFKTSECQTDLLFLQKGSVYKDFGLTQQFNLYAQLYKPRNIGFSFLLGYQYLKHGADELGLPCGSPHSQATANSAESLKEWTVHQIIVRADYDIGSHWDEPSIYPRLFVYAQLPFNGKRVAATSNVGLSFSLDF